MHLLVAAPVHAPAVVWRLMLPLVLTAAPVSEITAHSGQVEPSNFTGDVAKVSKKDNILTGTRKMARSRFFPKITIDLTYSFVVFF